MSMADTVASRASRDVVTFCVPQRPKASLAHWKNVTMSLKRRDRQRLERQFRQIAVLLLKIVRDEGKTHTRTTIYRRERVFSVAAPSASLAH